MVRDLPIYRAENAIDPGPDISDVEQILGILKQISRSRWWRKRSKTVLKLYLAWDAETGALKPYWARGEIYVWRPVSWMDILHEATHILIWKGNGLKGRSDHRSEFIRVYYEIVEHFLGAKRALALKESLLKNKVYGSQKAFKEAQ